MKKITKIFFCIMIIAGGLYFVNSYYDNIITQQIEGLFTPPVETTVKIHSTQTDKAPTIAQQVYNQLTDDEKRHLITSTTHCQSAGQARLYIRILKPSGFLILLNWLLLSIPKFFGGTATVPFLQVPF